MQEFSSGRRRTLAVLAACAIAYVLPAHAQDPHNSAAQAAARDWLHLADANDPKATYEAAAKRFHDTMTLEQWTTAMSQARNQFGAVQSRTLLSTQPPKPGPDVPPGDFLVVLYRSEFEKRQTGSETLTVERESDGKWRVVGYLMR